MLIVPRKRIWTQQPSAPSIDYSSPFSRALSYVATDGFGKNLVSGKAYTKGSLTGDAVPSIIRTGRATAFSGATAYGASENIIGNGDVTVLIVGNPRANGGVGYAFKQSGAIGSVWVGTNTNQNETLSSGQLCLGLLQNSVNRSAVLVPGATNGELNASLIGKKAGTGLAYVNGVKKAVTVVSTLAGAPTAAADAVAVGGDATDGTYAFNADLCLLVVWKRLLSDGEAKSITENPWQIFRAQDSCIFVPAGARVGGGDSLTASNIITSPATVGSPILSQKHALAASSLTSAPAVVASPVFTQKHSLSATAVSASPAVVASLSITQRHALIATAISAAAAVVGSPTLTEIVAGVMSALPIVSAPAVVGAPAITQKHALSAGAISAGPATFGTPTLAQQHALMAQGIAAGVAVIGLPILSEGGAVIFTSAPTGGGYSRSAEIYTRPQQKNTVRP